ICDAGKIGLFHSKSWRQLKGGAAERPCPGSLFPDGVAGAADGADDVGHAPAVDRLAQPPDMHVDRALVDIDGLAPDVVEQLCAREDAAGMPHHEFQELELRRPKLDLAFL